MNGAEALLKAAIGAGVELCFANPGTTEMPLVAALDSVPGARAVLCLHENVCTGAADGFARMSGRPALTLLHLGPGLGNGLANLHNARRARSPVVNLIGEHATWHRSADAPLTMDIESVAGSVSQWLRTSSSADALAGDAVAAVAAALQGQVASLIVAHDHQSAPARDAPVEPVSARPAGFDASRVEHCAQALRGAGKSALLLGGAALRGAGLESAAALHAATGADLFCDTFPARVERGAGRAPVQRLPYFPEQASALLAGYEHVVIAGTRAPVSFFGYPGHASRLLDESRALSLAGSEDDAAGALAALADALGAGRIKAHEPSRQADSGVPQGALDAQKICTLLAAHQPEDAIVVETAATTGLAYYPLSMNAPPHSYLALTGGAIGQGPPCAVGAALACPDRKVLNFQADGSAAYTLQAFWTQAREGLDVTTVLCSNRRYAILQLELMRAGVAEPGPSAMSLTELNAPNLDWVKLAEGFGVPGVAARTAEELDRELRRAFAEPGPCLIEAIF